MISDFLQYIFTITNFPMSRPSTTRAELNQTDPPFRRIGTASVTSRADPVIPIRPDHGPGYSFIGRLKGLAELRGVMRTVEAFRSGRVA